MSEWISCSSSDGSVTTTFEETVPTSTYLLAFIVSDFEFLSNENEGVVPHRTMSRPNAVHLTEFALEVGVELLDVLVEFIGVPYSLPKMDQAAIPDFAAGAMENWGLVTYRLGKLIANVILFNKIIKFFREPIFFYDINETTVFVEASISGVIAHEFAHQFFGNASSLCSWIFCYSLFVLRR